MMHPVEKMRWANFTKLLYEEHFLQLEQDQLRFRFERLRQGSIMVVEYRAKFTRVEMFAPLICTTEIE